MDKDRMMTTMAVDPRVGSIGVGKRFGFMEKVEVTEEMRRRARGTLPLGWRLVIQGPMTILEPERRVCYVYVADAPDIHEVRGEAPSERAARRCAMDSLKAAEVLRRAARRTS